ncbi:hypothetical protein [Mucilaginibacter sp. AK015]|uniref:hypothetical protein n=1 Tax=Mucilaginibacter sp. AK015 TaxID=2723072 RepID=UPI0016072DC8|nr:hypothetical protein [Mucilaginibacter sp. AK015]MBB5394706.1 hypothetical protein [Mucilaginibacter sp. AK015]
MIRAINLLSLIILVVILSLGVWEFLSIKKAQSDFNKNLNAINWDRYSNSSAKPNDSYFTNPKNSAKYLGDKPSDNIFWVKVGFSLIFCCAALFVILSARYDDETRKWAFSILTLIAGVWIGTVS